MNNFVCMCGWLPVNLLPSCLVQQKRVTSRATLKMASGFVDDCVKAMNVYRNNHQVSPLKHNRELTSVAQSWADYLAASGLLSHNPNASYRGERLGENCAMRWSSELLDYTGTLLTTAQLITRIRRKSRFSKRELS